MASVVYPKPDTVVYHREEKEEEVLLTTWERNAIVSSLEECLEQMATIHRRTVVKKNDINLSFVPTDVRYLDLIKSRLLYTSEERALRDMETGAVFQKLQSDSTHVVSILEETVEELRSLGSYSILRKISEKLTDVRVRELSVMSEAAKKVEALKSLKELYTQERHANEFEKKKRMEELAEALTEMETILAKGKSSVAYVSAWENARCEQNMARCKIAEEELRQTLTNLEIEEKNENRVTKEIEAFLCHNIDKNEEQIVNWKNRYDREWAEYNVEIGRLEKQINMQKTTLKRLKEEQRVKQDFIDEYLSEKEADRKKKEHEEYVKKSTIKIQAWWRGVMVRRKLGSYRPEEKKKKRPTKAKK